MRLSIRDLKSGMITEMPVISRQGRLLLGQGVILEEKHFRIFKIWGVTEIEVADGKSSLDSRNGERVEVDPDIFRKSREHIETLFSQNDPNHPMVSELMRICCDRLTDQLTRGKVMPIMNDETVRNPLKNSHKMGVEGIEIPSLDKLVNGYIKLASFPDIYFRITEVLNNPGSSTSQIAEVVSKDISLSAKLLKLVNSPFYGLPTRVDSIKRAITLIGSNELTTLALGISILNCFKNIPSRLINMKLFWKHSITCAVTAGLISQYKVGLSEERFFIGGLIHDIGRLILLKTAPEIMKKILIRTISSTQPTYEIEREIMGFDHAELSSRILQKWRFPFALENMVEYHHAPSLAKYGLEASIIHMADIVTIAMGMGVSGELYIPPIEKEAWIILGLSEGTLDPLIRQIDRQVSEIILTFLPDSDMT
ncbi:MAG: HDOD domain-containing protein [Candidatus Delongbacteria bacterium]|nr:HDOD domain-containing protein [Candidatus Delongbacteria bacterium]